MGDEQHTQMCNVVDAIDHIAVDDLQHIFEEGEAHGVGDKLKEIWTTDKRQQLEQFQKKYKEMIDFSISNVCYILLVTGKHSNQCSVVTIRIGKVTYETKL